MSVATLEPETYPTPAQTWRNKCKMCEGCNERTANYGYASEQKRRWCASCAAPHGATLKCRVEDQPKRRKKYRQPGSIQGGDEPGIWIPCAEHIPAECRSNHRGKDQIGQW